MKKPLSRILLLLLVLVLLGSVLRLSIQNKHLMSDIFKLQKAIEVRETTLISDMSKLISDMSKLQKAIEVRETTLNKSRGAPYTSKAAVQFAAAKKLNCLDFTEGGMAVILVAGQSNAANYVQTAGENHHGANLGSYYAGQCAVAIDPLMGADGELGSPWIRLGNELISSGKFKKVLFVPVALGGTGIARWRTGGDLNSVIINTLNDLQNKGIHVTHFLWTQGEADRLPGSRYRMNGGADYLDALQSLVNEVNLRSSAMIYVAQTSRCADTPHTVKEIRWAQKQITLIRTEVQLGPDLDALWEPGDRYDVCHFSEAGAKRLTDAWMRALYPKPS